MPWCRLQSNRPEADGKIVLLNGICLNYIPVLMISSEAIITYL